MKLHEAGRRIARAYPAGKRLGVLLSLAALIGTASDAAPELQSVAATRPAVQAPAAPIDESATRAFSTGIVTITEDFSNGGGCAPDPFFNHAFSGYNNPGDPPFIFLSVAGFGFP